MKKYSLFSLLILVSIVLFGQKDDTPGLYTWKGKKTTIQEGYVILKSDKKLEGKISLRGNKENVTGLFYSGEGKEIEFPMAALKSYGLIMKAPVSGNKVNLGPAICDHNESLFVWRDMGEQMGKKIENTKPRNGYVIKRDGSKKEGELQLKKSNGKIIEFKIKGDAGKVKLAFNQVANYGLLMTIDELTKSGAKVFKDEARNFKNGFVTLTNGEQKEGLIAFKKKTPINANKPGLGYKYLGLYFAKSKDAILKTYLNSEIISVRHNEVNYSPYQGGFVAENEMDNAKFRNKLKEFNLGSLTLLNGTVLKGKVAYINSQSVNYKSLDGIIKLYQSKEIERFDVLSGNEPKAVINVGNTLVEEYFKGNTFLAYKNPKPTTINEKKTNTARSLVGISTSATSALVISNDAKKNGYETNLDSLVLHSSVEDLKKYQNTLIAINGYKTSEELQENSTNETAKKYDAALGLAIGGKEAKEKIVIYFEEIVLKNLKTKETYILYKDKKDLNSKLEGLLMGCYTFLSLEKKDQKQYYDLDNIGKTTKMLDECY